MATTPEAHNATVLAALEAIRQNGHDAGQLEGVLLTLRNTKSTLEGIRDYVDEQLANVDKEIDRLSQLATPSAQDDAADEALQHKLSLPIDQLGLQSRTYNALWKNGFQTIGDLVRTPESTLRRLKGFGTASMVDLKRQLGGMGLGLQDAK